MTIRSTIDCLLATYALENDYCFLHQDKDFDPFQEHFGLKIIKGLRNKEKGRRWREGEGRN